jgi:hypothetical protein
MLILASSATSAVLGDDQRVDLDQARVLLHVELVERHRDRLELPIWAPLKPSAEGQLAALVGLQARGRVDVDGRIFSGVRRDFLDVHAAGGRADHRDAAAVAVQQSG